MAFTGEIQIFAGNFEPEGWAFCNGQLLPVSQWTALFQLLGTRYGGDGVTTFGVPDMRDRIGVGVGLGPGLQNYALGDEGGSDSVALTELDLPAHTHVLMGNQAAPVANGKTLGGGLTYGTYSATTMSRMAPLTVSGTSAGHENQQPYLCLHFMICLAGDTPQAG